VNDPGFMEKVLGLCGESGEVAEKFKKILRDKDGVLNDEDKKSVAKELGDVLWYLATIAGDMGLSLSQIVQWNLDKLHDRQKREKLHGSGDER
jgi:NTP pyrophosphatase (non-canonical NTP hydrolase)